MRGDEFDVQVQPNGGLLITATQEGRDWIAEQQERERDSTSILIDALEPYWTNGSYTPFDAGTANPFVGLTEAPCIAEDMSHHDDGKREVVGKLWWFPEYMLVDPVEELRTKGRVVFTAAPEPEQQPQRKASSLTP